MKLRIEMLALALVSTSALAQTQIPQPSYKYAGGVLGSYNYAAGSVMVPGGGHEYQHERIELGMTVGSGSKSFANTVLH